MNVLFYQLCIRIQTNHVGFSYSHGGKELLRMMLGYNEPKLGSWIPMAEINYSSSNGPKLGS